MKDINQTKTISELLNTFTFGGSQSKGKSFSDIIKQSTIFSFWEDIAGTKLSKFSKPQKIKYSKLFVSASSPVIIQELNLIKEKLIQKTNNYSKALGIEIKDIIFDYKNYKPAETQNYQEDNEVIYYKSENLSEYCIDENFKNEIIKNISKINFLNEKQKNNFIEQIINVKKAQIKRTEPLDK